MTGFDVGYRAFDRFQQRHRCLGYPLAVFIKYADDQGGYLAAAVTYYAFFAIFPLLLVLRGGAIGAGVLYEALQTLGGYYVGHVLRNASNAYGTFALVIGLLSLIYLGAHITLLAAEANVVATRRLWPRSFSIMIEQPSTRADKRALTQRGKVEERRQDETVSVDFPADEP